MIETKDQNGTVHAFAFDALGRKLHDRVVTLGSGVDNAVRRISTTYEVRGMIEKLTSYNDPVNERLYGMQDANWNLTSIANSLGVVQERFSYDPYGTAIVLTAAFGLRTLSSSDWETRFAGYRHDLDTGLSQVRNRVYVPLISWLQRDPLGFAAGIDLYEYVSSNPIVRVDPFGRQPLPLPVVGWCASTPGCQLVMAALFLMLIYLFGILCWVLDLSPTVWKDYFCCHFLCTNKFESWRESQTTSLPFCATAYVEPGKKSCANVGLTPGPCPSPN